MLGQTQLVTVIQEALAVCRKAGRQLKDTHRLERKKLEVAASLRHLQMVEEAGDDQVELERVVKSLEANPLLKDYRGWAEKAKI